MQQPEIALPFSTLAPSAHLVEIIDADGSSDGGAVGAVRRIPRQRERQPVGYTDEEIVRLWLGNLRSEHTRAAYTRDLRDFLGFLTGQGVAGLADVTRADVQAWGASQEQQAKSPASRARGLAAIKSLFKFAALEDHVAKNPAAGVTPPRVQDDQGRIAERILEEADVQRIFALETDARNGVLLRLLYASGCRVSEICGLTWGAVVDRDAGRGQITVTGKGNKTRAVVLSASMYAKLKAIKIGGEKASFAAAPVFLSSRQVAGAAVPKGIDRTQVLRIVKAAAKRAGIDQASPHWFRHCHASHALDRGEGVHNVKATLGHASIATTGKYLHVRPGHSSGESLAV